MLQVSYTSKIKVNPEEGLAKLMENFLNDESSKNKVQKIGKTARTLRQPKKP
jgi:hypothetical protein